MLVYWVGVYDYVWGGVMRLGLLGLDGEFECCCEYDCCDGGI